MKNYKILAESVTGYKGKQLLKDEVHPESEFMVDHCQLLCNAGHIEEVKEVPEKPVKEQPKKQDPLDKQDAE